MDRSAYLDHLVDTRVGMGKYYYLMSLALGSLFIADVCHINATGFLALNMKSEFGASELDVAILSCFFLAGLCMGALLTGVFTHYYGLKIPMIASALGVVFLDMLTSFAFDTVSLTCAWTLMGVALGFIGPLCNTMLSEVTPRPYRTMVFYVTGAFFAVGNLVLAGFVHVIFGGIKSGDWRFFLRVISSLAVVSAVIIHLLVKDSFRALIIKKQVNEGVDVLNHIGKCNHGESFQEITFDEKMEINEWLNGIYAARRIEEGPKILVQSPLLRITFSIFSVYFLKDLLTYGFSLYLPTILKKLELNNPVKEEQGLLVVSLAEFPALFIPILMIDRETFGRKGTFTLFSALAAALILYMYILEDRSVIILGFMWCFCQVPSKIVPFLATEYYPTNVRAWALGFGACIGRLGALISPFMTLYLLEGSIFNLFLLYGVAMIFMGAAVAYLPYETRGRPLDQVLEMEEATQSGGSFRTPNAKSILDSAQKDTPSDIRHSRYRDDVSV